MSATVTTARSTDELIVAARRTIHRHSRGPIGVEMAGLAVPAIRRRPARWLVLCAHHRYAETFDTAVSALDVVVEHGSDGVWLVDLTQPTGGR